MQRRSFLASLLAALSVRSAKAQPTNPAHVPILTRSIDNSRTGWNQHETILNQANVASRGIAKKFSLVMSGDKRGSEAQTLIVPNVTMGDGLRRDIALQGSMSGAMWCFDANNGEVLWVNELGRPVKGTKDFDMYAINDNFGILGTPVIDPDTKTLYCVSWSSIDRTVNTARFMAHALNISTGAKTAASVDLSDATYDPGHGLAKMTFGTIFRKQRAGLALTNVNGSKAIIIPFAAGSESSPTNHGWVIAVSTSPFRIAAAWNNSPHYQGGGIWQGSQAPAVDANGDVYFVAGNGSFDGVTDFGECATKLRYAPSTSLIAVDWWARFTDAARSGASGPVAAIPNEARPSNKMIRMPEGDAPVNAYPDQPRIPLPSDVPRLSGAAWQDQDEGSAGILLVPSLDLSLHCGKDGILSVLNSNNMGKSKLSDFSSAAGIKANYAKAKQILWFTFFPGYDVSPTPTDLTQLNIDFGGKTHHMHSTPVYYESPLFGPMIFCCGENAPVRAWGVSSQGVRYLANSDEVSSPNANGGGMPGGMMCVSSDGKKPGTGLLVCCFPYGDANKGLTQGYFVLYDPENFATRPDGSKQLRALWKSSDWGIEYTHCKLNVPVPSGGMLYIPTYDGEVLVFGPTGN